MWKTYTNSKAFLSLIFGQMSLGLNSSKIWFHMTEFERLTTMNLGHEKRWHEEACNFLSARSIAMHFPNRVLILPEWMHLLFLVLDIIRQFFKTYVVTKGFLVRAGCYFNVFSYVLEYNFDWLFYHLWRGKFWSPVIKMHFGGHTPESQVPLVIF